MLGSHSTDFVEERMDVTGKGEQMVRVFCEVPFLFIFSILFLPLSTFSTEIISVGSSLDSFIHFRYPH